MTAISPSSPAYLPPEHTWKLNCSYTACSDMYYCPSVLLLFSSGYLQINYLKGYLGISQVAKLSRWYIITMADFIFLPWKCSFLILGTMGHLENVPFSSWAPWVTLKMSLSHPGHHRSPWKCSFLILGAMGHLENVPSSSWAPWISHKFYRQMTHNTHKWFSWVSSCQVINKRKQNKTKQNKTKNL
jgi:serine/threonine protein kinase